MEASSDNRFIRLGRKLNQRIQHLLDKSSPYVFARWICLILALACYVARVWYLRGMRPVCLLDRLRLAIAAGSNYCMHTRLVAGFYIVTYGLGIYNLNLLLGFITPQFDPELEGPELPTKADEEFRPFVRRLPEFKFW